MKHSLKTGDAVEITNPAYVEFRQRGTLQIDEHDCMAVRVRGGMLIGVGEDDITLSPAVTLGRKGGKANTPAKVAAAKANGRKGGRPRKRQSST